MRILAPALLILIFIACGTPAEAPRKAKGETPLVNQAKSADLDENLPVFVPDPSVPETGIITCVGSDSMDPLMKLWAEDFRASYPQVQFEIISKGSATAPKAMLAGSTLLGHMSREMNTEELTAFQAKFGYSPTRIVVAVDALAIYVNANNPITKLGLEQVDAIFSKDRKGGYAKSLDTWGDLGLAQGWTNRVIQPYGRDENSGTRAFFREHAMKKGEYKPTVKAMPDQFAVVEAAAIDATGIAYGPVQHSVRMVKAVPIMDFKGTTPLLPTVENILNGKYPLTRFLYLYVNLAPGKPLDPLIKEFISSILSRQGQSNVTNFGAIPLPSDLASVNKRKLK